MPKLFDLHTTSTYQSNHTDEWIICIPRILVCAPIIQNVDASSDRNYDKYLNFGVAHMAGSPLPGKRNSIIFGHSSSLTKSKYANIFSTLNDVKPGDSIYVLNKTNKRNYIFVINNTYVTSRRNTSILAQTKTARITIITCWPPGQDRLRLIVTANIL